jgi:hypothetical protein
MSPVPQRSKEKKEMADTWTNRGVIYTIDAKDGTGGVITAQEEHATRIHSRIVSRLVNRDEAEKLFEDDLSRK